MGHSVSVGCLEGTLDRCWASLEEAGLLRPKHQHSRRRGQVDERKELGVESQQDQFRVSRVGLAAASQCWALRGSETRWGDVGRSRVAGSAHCWRATDKLRPGVRATDSDQSPYEMVVTAARSGQLGEIAPVVDSGLVEWRGRTGQSHYLRALTLTRTRLVD
jgi:hypothetical protein